VASQSPKEARLNFRLPTDLKEIIEEAATITGQSVSDFAIAAMISNAQSVLQQNQSTALTTRDRKAFMALLDAQDAKPNRALTRAANRYKKHCS
jgi:uncharacterized protein (DUF1778 family)